MKLLLLCLAAALASPHAPAYKSITEIHIEESQFEHPGERIEIFGPGGSAIPPGDYRYTLREGNDSAIIYFTINANGNLDGKFDSVSEAGSPYMTASIDDGILVRTAVYDDWDHYLSMVFEQGENDTNVIITYSRGGSVTSRTIRQGRQDVYVESYRQLGDETLRMEKQYLDTGITEVYFNGSLELRFRNAGLAEGEILVTEHFDSEENLMRTVTDYLDGRQKTVFPNGQYTLYENGQITEHESNGDIIDQVVEPTLMLPSIMPSIGDN